MTIEQMVEAVKKLKLPLPGIAKILCLPEDEKRLGVVPAEIKIEPCPFLKSGTAYAIDTDGYFMAVINLNARELLVMSNEYRQRMRKLPTGFKLDTPKLIPEAQPKI